MIRPGVIAVALKPSLRATYDSAKTGPRYHVTTTINDHVEQLRAFGEEAA